MSVIVESLPFVVPVHLVDADVVVVVPFNLNVCFLPVSFFEGEELEECLSLLWTIFLLCFFETFLLDVLDLAGRFGFFTFFVAS